MAFVYRYYNDEGVLLYIGESLSYIRRLSEHLKKASWVESVCSVTLERFDTKKQAQNAEREAIEKENPVFNKQYNQKTKSNSKECFSLKPNEELEMTFKELIDSKGLSTKEVANKCNVTTRTVYNWLNGLGEPKRSQWLIIENYKP